MQAQPFKEAYRNLLTDLQRCGVCEINERTGTKIKMLQGGYSFKLDLSDGRLPIAGNRRYYPHIAAAETAWQFMGTQDPTFILRHAPKLWSKFVEFEKDYDQTGHLSGGKDILKTAYGYRWRKAFGRDQLMQAVDCLENDPTNRQLWIQAWDPANDGLGGPQPKNIPCPIGFSVSRERNNLHMSVFIRSSDVFVGLPYDVMAYSLTADAIAASCGLTPASLHITLHHAHLYEPHWAATKACLDSTYPRGGANRGASTSWISNCQPNLPCWDIQTIFDNPNQYVKQVKALAKRVRNNSWDPRPIVIE